MNKRIKQGKDPCRRKGIKDHLRTMMLKTGAVFLTAVAVAGTATGSAGVVQANTPVTYLTGKIEVDNVEGQVTAYKAFRIFDANKNDDGTMSNFDWPSISIRDAVLGVVNNNTNSHLWR